eukprot:TRINITY_DN115_c0_g1_i1.p1 TRINITY_DN115_c0_g1~~TRINITY_DN115_c0_g1_i1.p1  ORF type:complete len:324 (-),score=65.73 TRINITY_DN115_c0_g1_i1:95-1018(-)
MDKVPIFSNVGKPTNDFFTKGFPSTHKAELSTTSANGLTFVSSAERKSAKGNDYILGKLEAKYKWQQLQNSLDLSAAVDTDGLLKGDVGIVHASLPNLKVVVKPQAGKTTEVAFGFEFQNTNLSSASTILWKQAGDASLTASVVAGAGRGISVGLESVYAFRRSTPKPPAGLESIKALVNVKRDPTLEFSVYAKEQWNVTTDAPQPVQKLTVGGSYEHKPSTATTLYSLLEWDSTKKDSKAFAVQFGASYKVDADTTVQGKLDQAGLLTVNVAKQLTPHVKGNISSTFNTLDLAASDHKLAAGVLYK